MQCSTLETEYKVPQLVLLLVQYARALPFIFGQLSVYSTHQSHCNWSAVSWLHLLLFHYKQDQAAAGTHLGQWEMRSVKPRLLYGRRGQVTTLWWLGCRLNWHRAASDWWKRKPPIAGDQVLTVTATSRLADRSRGSPHAPCGPGTYWCLLMFEVVKAQNVR